MGKFNNTKESVKPTEINDMGSPAFKLGKKEELVSIGLTTFLQPSYYETESEITKRIISLINKNDPIFVAKVALYLRRIANMRSVSHLIAGELARHISGMTWAGDFYKKIVVRPDDMTEILAYVFHNQAKRKIPNAIRRGFAEVLQNLDPYQIDKYKMNNRNIKLIDLVNLLHPKPQQKNAEAYRRLLIGKPLDDLYENKTFEKTMSSVGEDAKDVGATIEEIDDMKGEVMMTLLSQPQGMPIMSLLRNLRNLLLYCPQGVPLAVKQLTNENAIINSKQLPFRFGSAYNVISALQDPKGTKSVSFENDGLSFKEGQIQLLEALETALHISCQNIPVLGGNTAILTDHSGSVRGDAGGSGKLSAFGVTTSAMVGNLMSTLFAFSQENVYIGLFGDRLINVPVDRSKGIMEFNQYSFAEGGKCGPGTEDGLYVFLDNCIREKIRVDNLIIFSDMVIGDGGKGRWDSSSGVYRRLGYKSFQDLFRQFKVINPKCSTISINIRDTKGTSVFDRSMNVTQVAGWSSALFDSIKNATRGYDELIKEIEAVQI